ncbi:MAG: hypothetical protein K6G26_02850 [Lachnospiraceae bacterium]|nr:hypothetical protein [Lachnospiraceae bacterium]
MEKKYIISKVLEAVNYLSSKGYLELEELKQPCDVIIKSDYVNEWLWKKTVKLKNKSVQIKVIHEVDKVSI